MSACMCLLSMFVGLCVSLHPSFYVFVCIYIVYYVCLLCMFVGLFQLFMFVGLCVCCPCLSVCPSAYMCVCLFMFVRLCVCLCVHVCLLSIFVCRPVSVFVCLCVCDCLLLGFMKTLTLFLFISSDVIADVIALYTVVTLFELIDLLRIGVAQDYMM